MKTCHGTEGVNAVSSVPSSVKSITSKSYVNPPLAYASSLLLTWPNHHGLASLAFPQTIAMCSASGSNDGEENVIGRQADAGGMQIGSQICLALSCLRKSDAMLLSTSLCFRSCVNHIPIEHLVPFRTGSTPWEFSGPEEKPTSRPH
ncbi:hypothetical protein E2C01_020483 [Portunus trituberculatus]|uniref:Uncharacterized protein n=1 Tax=Portunus trituberculatus TaxID=210409 RepID=A0A5B7E3H5_PORTR|nr:hypothetical protein [Portunus trituberculatus]